MTRTPFQRLERIGTAAYGSDWMSAAARDTGRNDRTLRRWKSGETELPADHPIFSELAIVLRRRAKRLARLAEIAERMSVQR